MTRWWQRLLRYSRAQALEIAALVAVMLLKAAFEVLRPWPLKAIMDSQLSNHAIPAALAWLPGPATAQNLLLWMTVATVVLFLAGWGLNCLQAYIGVGAGNRMTYAVGLDVFAHLQRLSLRFHGKRPTGDLVQRVVTDANCARRLVFGAILPLFSSIATLAWMAAIMWKLDATLALVTVGVAPFLCYAINRSAPGLTARAQAESEKQGELLSAAEQTLTALPVVQAFGREKQEAARFHLHAQAAGDAYRRNIWAQLRFKITANSLTATGTAVVMLVGGIHVLRGQLPVSSLVVFLSYVAALYAPLETLAYLSGEYAGAAAGARRVFEILESEDRVKSAPDAKVLPPAESRHLRMEAVEFGYEPGRPVLHGITFEARPGEMVALVGPTGAGKSTILSLIPRFFDPWHGRVTIDGVDIRSLQLANARDQVSVVLQEPFLLPLTIASNIAYGRPSATREQIVAAAVAANAHEFIVNLPKGYDTVVGERGDTLSGGQKQRLAIARAILKNAPILLLDEPTSALDAVTESLLMEALDRVMKDRTTIVIAHRLATVRRADRIVVIEDGRVVESGTHDALLSAGGEYARLYQTQFVHAREVSAG